IAMVVSTTAGTPRGDLAGKQIFFTVLGLIAAGVLLAIDYRILLQYSPGLYGFTLLVLLLLPIFGKRIAGAKSWLKMGSGFQLQPSEFARISIALLLAWILENDDRALLRPRTIAAIGAAIGVPIVLVLLQPDLGLALTYLPFLAAALFFGGIAGGRVFVELDGCLIARALALARDARDRGGAMLVLLLILNIAAQALVNVAMNGGVMPTTGITLPFVSYGASSLIGTGC